jgi:uncharacterized membrane protein (DUF485 family)
MTSNSTQQNSSLTPFYLILTLIWLAASIVTGVRHNWFGCILFLLVTVASGAYSWKAAKVASKAATEAEKQRQFEADFYEL